MGIAAILSFAIAACTTPDAKHARTAQPRADTAFADVEDFIVPRQVEDFALEDVRQLEPRELGSQARYTTFQLPTARIDLFVYPVLVPDLFPLSQALDAAQRAMLGDVATATPASVEVVSQELTTVPAGSHPLQGIRTDFAWTTADGTPLRSHTFLAVRGRHYLKVRFSYEAEVEEVGRPSFARFLAAVVAETAKSPAGDPVEIGLTITRTTWEIAAHDRPCAAIAWGYGYGPERMAALERGEFADSFEREFAARAKTIDFWERLRSEGAGEIRANQCTDSSLDAMVEVRRAGLLDEYVWRYFAKPYWNVRPDLDLVTFAQYEKRVLGHHDPVLDPGLVERFNSDAATGSTAP